MDFQIDESCTLYMGEIEPFTTEKDIRSYFKGYEIYSLKIVRDFVTHQARYAYINFYTPQETQNALHAL